MPLFELVSPVVAVTAAPPTNNTNEPNEVVDLGLLIVDQEELLILACSDEVKRNVTTRPIFSAVPIARRNEGLRPDVDR